MEHRLQLQSDWDTALQHGESFFLSLVGPEGKTLAEAHIDSSAAKRSGAAATAADFSSTAPTDVRVVAWDAARRSLTVEATVPSAAATTASTTATTLRQRFRAPVQGYAAVQGGREVCSVDLSPGGDFAASAGGSGSLHLWTVADGRRRFALQGFVADCDVLFCRFFPSGTVVLGAGADFRLRIFSATEGWQAAVLAGHRGGVLGAGFVDRGRNLISCSRDGSALLWDVSTQTTIGQVGQSTAAINAVWVARSDLAASAATAAAAAAAPGEVGTDGHVALLACQSGGAMLCDVRSRSRVAHFGAASNGSTAAAAANVCALPRDFVVAVGGDGGRLTFWDARRTDGGSPLGSYCTAAGADIRSLAVDATGAMWVGDGSGVVARVSAAFAASGADAGATLTEQLTGPNYEPVTAISVRGTTLLTGSRDGIVRRYDIGATDKTDAS